jgi:hypothetical protein
MCVVWIRGLAVGLVAVVAIGSACSPPGEAGRSAGARITVLAVMGPIMPVCRVGMTCSAPYRRRVVLRSSGGQEWVIGPDRRGHALVSLAPGTYEIGEPAGVASQGWPV